MRSYLEDKPFQDVYPNIVCFCTDVRTRAGDCDDIGDLVATSQIPIQVSALAAWKSQEITCCFKNPYGKKLEWKSRRLKEFFLNP